MKHIYEPIKLSIDLPKEVLEKLCRDEMLNDLHSYSGDLCIMDYRATIQFKQAVESMIVKKCLAGELK